MFRPPSTTIHDLPDELYLHIGAQFTDLERNTHLASLALVSRRWRHIAQEWLLKVPRLKLTYIDKYLLQLAHHAHLHAQIQTLEIHSSSDGRISRDPRGLLFTQYAQYEGIAQPTHWEFDFIQICDKIIQHYAKSTTNYLYWRPALTNDVVPALFGILLCILPNLRELRLGDSWLMDMPIFYSMLPRDAPDAHVLPQAWRHVYLQDVLTLLLPRLEVLDVPADTSMVSLSHLTGAVFDFRRFEKLKELGISMRALWWCQRSSPGPADPREVFPASLEVLHISEANEYTPHVLQILCAAKKGGHFPALRRVEVYYMYRRERVEERQSNRGSSNRFMPPAPRPVDLQMGSRDAEIELYVYYPEWELKTWEIGRSPWTLRREREVFERARREALMKATATLNRFLGARRPRGPQPVQEGAELPGVGMSFVLSEAFEQGWDRDGDVVMLD